jgi:hypothetical protein
MGEGSLIRRLDDQEEERSAAPAQQVEAAEFFAPDTARQDEDTAQEFIEVFECNVESAVVFLQCRFDSAVGMGGVVPLGISATEIRSACLLLRIPRDRHPELLENVRLMSRAACKMLSERRGT